MIENTDQKPPSLAEMAAESQTPARASLSERLGNLFMPIGGGDDTEPKEPGPDLPQPVPPTEIPDGHDLPTELPGGTDPPPVPPARPYMEEEGKNRSGGDLQDDAPVSGSGTRPIPL